MKLGKTLLTFIVLVGMTACSGAAQNDAAPAKSTRTLPPLGDPIDVEATEEWVWVPIEGTVCADGSEAGVGVNFTTQSRDLVIWFQGNGVCYDQTTCTVLFRGLLTGMGSDPLDHMWWGDKNTGHLGIFDRTNPDNPLKASNFIVFPHCGVDGHTADKDTDYPGLTVHQHGYANVTVALDRIVPTFLDAGRIVVAGFSAGGIGAGANYHQIATAFEAVGETVPFLIDDGGPVLRPPYLGPNGQEALRTGWGLDKTLESWCPRCATEGYHTIHETLAELHPGLRSSVVCAYGDGVATPLYALLNGTPFDGSTMEQGLRDLSEWTASFQPEVAPSIQHEFLYPGTRHGALVVAPLPATPGLTEFLSAQLDDSPTWATVQQ
jgi:hypothetical protein